MTVFNYAAIKIQQNFRSHYVQQKLNGKMTPPRRKSKLKQNTMLDKYLNFSDQFNRLQVAKPQWLQGGYSSYAAVHIQAWWRMVKCVRRYKYHKRAVNQIAALVVQTAFRNFLFQRRMKDRIARLQRGHDQNITRESAFKVQRAWRSFCNRRVYNYFRDLVINKLKSAPADILRTIIPNEVDFLDSASGVHVKFRLGGSTFPPRVVFKIFTHRPLCDVNAFAPRFYCEEKEPDEDERFNKQVLGNGAVSNRQETLVNGQGHSPIVKGNTNRPIRVGQKYFDTVVSTSSASGTDKWYKREENNPWRPIAAQLIVDTFAPPWAREDDGTLEVRKPLKHFHFSRARRREDVIRDKKRRKREWMLKAYMAAAMREEDNCHSESPSPRDSYHDLYQSYGGVEGKGGEGKGDEPDLKIQGTTHTRSHEYIPSKQRGGRRDSIRSDEDDQNLLLDAQEYAERMAKMHTGVHSTLSPTKSMRADSRDKGDRKDRGSDAKREDIYDLNYYNVGKGYDADANEDLLKWSLALDFEEYSKEWSTLATSMPSDLDKKRLPAKVDTRVFRY
jgi:hypothetical protein